MNSNTGNDINQGILPLQKTDLLYSKHGASANGESRHY